MYILTKVTRDSELLEGPFLAPGRPGGFAFSSRPRIAYIFEINPSSSQGRPVNTFFRIPSTEKKGEGTDLNIDFTD